MSTEVVIIWFRQDLRLSFNSAVKAAALHQQLSQANIKNNSESNYFISQSCFEIVTQPLNINTLQMETLETNKLMEGITKTYTPELYILPIYIFDDCAPDHFKLGKASKTWLHYSLLKLNESLHGNLNVYVGSVEKIFQQLLKLYNVKKVLCNRCYEPWHLEQEKAVQKLCEYSDPNVFQVFNDNYLSPNHDYIAPNKMNKPGMPDPNLAEHPISFDMDFDIACDMAFDTAETDIPYYKVFTAYKKKLVTVLESIKLTKDQYTQDTDTNDTDQKSTYQKSTYKLRVSRDLHNTTSLSDLCLLDSSNDFSKHKDQLKDKLHDQGHSSIHVAYSQIECQAGELAAQKKFNDFIQKHLYTYQENRNYPAKNSMSQLSAYLHFGEISPIQIFQALKTLQYKTVCAQSVGMSVPLQAPQSKNINGININDININYTNAQENIESFLSEIIWREFACYLLHHSKNMHTQNFNAKFDNFPWYKTDYYPMSQSYCIDSNSIDSNSNDSNTNYLNNISHSADPSNQDQSLPNLPHTHLSNVSLSTHKSDSNHVDKLFLCWKKGQTGYPLVDAGMRELLQTGYMHNRVRMVVASFLVKNLNIHWKQGMDWFWQHLFDADLASNSMNWQWVAGSGVDAAPFFRVFNPILQGEKFDPTGEYIKKYVPELQNLPNKYLFQPSAAPGIILLTAGIKLVDSKAVTSEQTCSLPISPEKTYPEKTYPLPIVDLNMTRLQALERYKKLNMKS